MAEKTDQLVFTARLRADVPDFSSCRREHHTSPDLIRVIFGQ